LNHAASRFRLWRFLVFRFNRGCYNWGWRGWLRDNLQVVHYDLYTFNLGGISGCSDPLRILVGITRKRYQAIARLDSNPPALDVGISIDLVLHILDDLPVISRTRTGSHQGQPA
jgi:hypothetical protein